MRLFLALPLSDEMKNALIGVQDRLYDSGVRGSFTPGENLHLTLAFLGELPAAEPVLDALASFSFAPFDLTLEGLGRFGDLWWAGTAPSEPLTALARRLRRALAAGGIPYDRSRFLPHVTLIRRAVGELPGTEIPAASMRVTAVSLMRSDRGRNAMLYTELGSIAADG